MSRIILSSQLALVGRPAAIGCEHSMGTLRVVERAAANEMIRANHYSGTFVPNSSVHFGWFVGGRMLGALQFGPAMNPASGASVVPGTPRGGYLELNRMWLSDECPRNSESAAISCAMRIIERDHGHVGWVQSFADERCGGLGVVYQACSFVYVGEHTSTFWEIDGEWFHNYFATVTGGKTPSRAEEPKVKWFQANKDRAVPHELRQFRYIKPIHKYARDYLATRAKPYPKAAVAGRA
jgi:hypothetical protein